MLAVAVFAAQNISAQTVLESKNADNWYLGINGGFNVPAKNFDFGDINYQAGLRLGRWFTPVVGLAAEGQFYFGKNGMLKGNDKTFPKYTDVNLLGTLNLSNWFGGYKGTARDVELIALAGLGWGRDWDKKDDSMTSKLGLDLAFNFGSDKQWQFYIEPALVYTIAGIDNVNGVAYNINHAVFQANLGLSYKFGNSNGTHNFKIAQLRDQAEIDGLNAKINELRAENGRKDGKIAADGKTIADLQAQLTACKNKKPETQVKVIEKANSQLQPIVIFGQGKSTLDNAGMASVEMVAKYMKNHKNSKVLVKGYASPEGNAELNQKLSVARAEAVKTALVKKYKIAADRVSTQGMGATSEISEENDFNRVAMFFDTTVK